MVNPGMVNPAREAPRRIGKEVSRFEFRNVPRLVFSFGIHRLRNLGVAEGKASCFKATPFPLSSRAWAVKPSQIVLASRKEYVSS